MDELDPRVLAAAWGAWRARNPEGRLGPGPGFREAIAAALTALVSAPPAPTPEAGSDLAGLSHEDAETLAWVAQELAGRGQVKAAGVVSKAMVFGRLNAPSPPPAEDLAGQGEPLARLSGGHQPHPFQPHEKYPGCAVCGYAASERLMHPAAPAPSRAAKMEVIANAVATVVMELNWAIPEPSGDDEDLTDEHCRRHSMIQEAALRALRDAEEGVR